MSTGPMGMIGSIAGTPLAQTKVSQHEGEVPHAPPPTRPGSSATADVHAAGIGQIEEELKCGDRDADGRQRWQQRQQEPPSVSQQSAGPSGVHFPENPTHTDEIGTTLDLSG